MPMQRAPGKRLVIPGPGHREQRATGVPLPYESRMEMRSSEWEWRTLYYRGRHPQVDAAGGDPRLFEPETCLTLLGDLVFLYTPVRVLLMVVLRFELPNAEGAGLDRWLVTQLDHGDREVAVEYFLGTYLHGWSGPPLRPRE